MVISLGCASIVLLLSLGFAGLGSEVREGDTPSLDAYVLARAADLRATYPGVAVAMRDISGMGSTTVLFLLAAIAAGYLALVGSRTSACLAALSALCGTGVMHLLKLTFARSRPPPEFAALSVDGWSFPSGHASLSAVVYLTLGVLLAATREKPRERLYILACAALVVALIGVSRVVLEVHWATDVLAGWAFGSAWALAWLLLDWHLRRRKTARS